MQKLIKYKSRSPVRMVMLDYVVQIKNPCNSKTAVFNANSLFSYSYKTTEVQMNVTLTEKVYFQGECHPMTVHVLTAVSAHFH
jgi:hypothetical protein